jgi:hypothetical protein
MFANQRRHPTLGTSPDRGLGGAAVINAGVAASRWSILCSGGTGERVGEDMLRELVCKYRGTGQRDRESRLFEACPVIRVMSVAAMGAMEPSPGQDQTASRESGMPQEWWITSRIMGSCSWQGKYGMAQHGMWMVLRKNGEAKKDADGDGETGRTEGPEPNMDENLRMDTRVIRHPSIQFHLT